MNPPVDEVGHKSCIHWITSTNFKLWKLLQVSKICTASNFSHLLLLYCQVNACERSYSKSLSNPHFHGDPLLLLLFFYHKAALLFIICHVKFVIQNIQVPMGFYFLFFYYAYSNTLKLYSLMGFTKFNPSTTQLFNTVNRCVPLFFFPLVI